jgi:hypothetical protein
MGDEVKFVTILMMTSEIVYVTSANESNNNWPMMFQKHQDLDDFSEWKCDVSKQH